jgi:Phosphotransferase enzyme family
MTLEETNLETVEYRLVLVQPDSREILALDAVGAWHLPIVRIPQWTRPAVELRKTVRNSWDLHILVLETFMDGASAFCAIAELLYPNNSSELKAVPLGMIDDSELSEEERVQVASLLSDNSKHFFSTIGWLDQVALWLEAETGRKLTSKIDIEQYNAGGGFSLVCFHTEDEWRYWLKATGDPNAHELAITCLLSELGGAYLPEMIASRPAWNAWLMSGEAKPITELPADPLELFRLLEDAVESMAELQMRTEGRTADLLRAGAFDQSMESFQTRSGELFEYLHEAMAAQTSTKAAPIDKIRLEELRTIFEAACRRVEELDLPQTIVHGDMNYGNILTGCGHSQFIDWCEAYVGNPLITLQHLLLLNKVQNPELRQFMNSLLKDRYRTVWPAACDPAAIDEGFLYMPLLAVASSLYGRGDWLHSQHRDDARRWSYARSLARHLDRAARDPQLLEALCH